MGKVKYNNNPPETERALMALQSKYLEDKTNKEVFNEFFLLVKAYSRSIALNILKQKGKFLPPERVDEVSVDATMKTFSMYEKNEGWSVKGSWKGQLYFKCVEALFGQAEEEKQSKTSLNLEVGEDGGKELVDLLSDSQGVVPWGVDGESTYDPVTVMFRGINVAPEEIRDCLNSAHMNMDMGEYILFLMWVLLRIRKPNGFDKTMENFRQRFLVDKRGYEEDFDAYWLDLHTRLENHIE